MSRSGGLLSEAPFFSAAFFILALSLAGIPPLTGFWAKYHLLMEGLGRGFYGSVGVSLLVSVFTLMSMVKIWNAVFWAPGPAPEGAHPKRKRLALLVSLSALLVILASAGSGTLYGVARTAASQAFDREGYRERVFFAPGKPERK